MLKQWNSRSELWVTTLSMIRAFGLSWIQRVSTSPSSSRSFAFVAEKSDKGMQAKQKPVQLGDIIGNNYVVQSGLVPGEQLIVSGLQKIRDGSPVMPAPPAGAAPTAPKAP